jgi:general secretion pathway protein I
MKKGFTLIEVLIAIAVLGTTLGLIIALFAGGLRSARLTEGYSQALLLAREKMDDVLIWKGSDSEEVDEEESGTVQDFSWEKIVSPFVLDEEADDETSINFNKVDIIVRWKEGIKEKSLSLQGLVMADKDELELLDETN